MANAACDSLQGAGPAGRLDVDADRTGSRNRDRDKPLRVAETGLDRGASHNGATTPVATEQYTRRRALQHCRQHQPMESVGQRGELAIDSAPLALDARRSEEHTSELQSLMRISYAVFCLKKKTKKHTTKTR